MSVLGTAMSKVAVLRLDGDLVQGVRTILSIGEEDNRPNTETTGELPANLNLAMAIDQWQANYRSLGKANRIQPIEIINDSSIHQWRTDCQRASDELREHLNNWLLSESFRPIRDQWLKQLMKHEVRVLIRTASQPLLKLPWHLWNLVDQNPLAEVALSAPDAESTARAKRPTLRNKVRILAILGNSTGINVQRDRQLLENLPDAETIFLVEPQRQEINDQLWEQTWDILFFAGHSRTEKKKGLIYLNQTDKSLTIPELEYALQKAVNKGMQLAIFNSCDGMGLAFDLQQLHIPQIIVMREPVPDQVAQAFLTYFLPAFAGGQSLYLAERVAREKLQGLEHQFPCASWLPVIFQNPATVPHTWSELGRRPTDTCPYRGLFAFQEKDAQFFFGREAFINKLLEAVQKQSLVAVIGSSGSGKSSVVFAGLIPRLRKIGNWLIVAFRPSSKPFHALANALLNQLEPQMSGRARRQEIRNLVTDLQQEENALRDVVEDIVRKNPSSKLLLVVDQFEELYTLSDNIQDCQVFLDRLLEAIQISSNLSLVITLRADFLGQALAYRPFADALQYRDLKLGPMNHQELQAAIEQPAALFGVTLESGLTERILSAVTDQAGNLPLLEFTLTQLWEKQTDILLTHAAYNQINGVEAAVTGYAEQVYDKLNLEDKERTRRILIQLVHLGEGTEDTRRLATRAEVGDENWDLVTRLASERLVVTGCDEATGKETVEVVHEALIQKWGRLHQWIELDRDFHTWQQELRATMQQWDKSGRDEDALLRGKPLADAKEWLQKRPDELTVEQEYIIASLALRQREQKKQERLKRQSKRLILAGSAGVTLIVTGALGFGWWQAEIQRRQAIINEINALTVSSEKLSIANQKFDALIYGLKAGKKLKQAVGANLELKKQVVLALQQAVDNLKEFNRLQGHTNWIYGVSFSPDGKTIATASLDKTVKLWNLDGSLRKTLQHDDKVHDVSFCAQGKMFATASLDKTVKLWNIDGSLRKTLKHDDNVHDVSFNPDCKILASASEKQVLLWNVDNGDRKIFKKYSNTVNSVSFSPKEQIIAIATDDNKVRLLNLDGKEIQNFNGHTDKVYNISFSPNGKTIATASWDNTVKIWNLDGTLRTTLRGHTDRVFGVSFSPNGKTIATASWDRTVKLWNPDGTLRMTINGQSDRITSVAFSPNGKIVASGGADNTVKLWAIDGNSLPIQGHSSAIRSVSFSPSGKMIATASEDGTAKLWTPDGQLLKTLNHIGGVYGVSFSPDGKMIATASADNTAKLWKLDGKEIATLKGHGDQVFYASFSPDAEMIATASADKTAKLWNRDGKEIRTFRGHRDRVVDISFSPNGKIIATASDDHTAKIWKLDGTLCATLQGHEDEVNGISFSPNGKMIATASDDKTIKLWKLDNTLCQIPNKIIKSNKTLISHQERVISVKFSQDGQQIASASFDKTVKLWKLDGSLLHTFQGHDDWVWSVDFRADGKQLVSVSNDTTVRFWNLDKTQTQILDLDSNLDIQMKKGCSQVSDYLRNNSKVSESDKQLCDQIKRN
jgi:WD40 repeat protein/energy-coupling factor transporter ATP-binding protein EcfA2